MKKKIVSIVAAFGVVTAVLFTILSPHRAEAEGCRVYFSGIWYTCNENPDYICTAVMEEGELRICLGEAGSPNSGDINP